MSACMPTETLNEKHTNIKKTHGERQREDKDLGGAGVSDGNPPSLVYPLPRRTCNSEKELWIKNFILFKGIFILKGKSVADNQGPFSFIYNVALKWNQNILFCYSVSWQMSVCCHACNDYLKRQCPVPEGRGRWHVGTRT